MIFTEITLDGHHREDFLRFEKKISTIDEVIECHLVSGGYDYLLKFITQGIAHYQELMDEVILKEFGIDQVLQLRSTEVSCGQTSLPSPFTVQDGALKVYTKALFPNLIRNISRQLPTWSMGSSLVAFATKWHAQHCYKLPVPVRPSKQSRNRPMLGVDPVGEGKRTIQRSVFLEA